MKRLFSLSMKSLMYAFNLFAINSYNNGVLMELTLSITRKFGLRSMLLFAFLISGIFNLQASSNEKCEIPYFEVVDSENPGALLPLHATNADVLINGCIAKVKINQIFKNDGKKPIEAIYVFPASASAAVYSMKMMIGKRIVEAKVMEKDAARKTYDDARKDGYSASLLEQHRPNVFQMNVANIMPGDTINVELIYTEMLIPETGIYSFVYPTVVGPRYENAANNSASWTSNPYLAEGTPPSYQFDISVKISAGMPVHQVKCPTHDADIQFISQQEASINLKKTEAFRGNKDFIVNYSLRDRAIQSGLLLYDGNDEKYFLAMVQPPAIVNNANIPKREYVFIVDVSGSMFGFPLDISKALMKELLQSLRPTDRFNIVLFAGTSSVYALESKEATPENIKNAISHIDNQQGSGSTELLHALQTAMSLKINDNYSRSFVIVTDGYVTVEKESFDYIRQHLNKANFFPFGIGSSVNRYIIEGMAHVGMGTPFVVTNSDDAKEIATKFKTYIQSPVLTNIKVEYEGFEAYDIEPLTVPDVFAERPVLIYGKYKGAAKGIIKISGISGQGLYTQTLKVSDFKASKQNTAVMYLWARERVKMLSDYASIGNSEEYKSEVVSIGLKYNLLTQYTSFVAVDSEKRNPSGQYNTVVQPLALPEGVSNYATSNNYPASVGYSGGYRKSCAKENKAYSTVDELEETVVAQPSVSIPDSKPVFISSEKDLDNFITKNMQFPIDLKSAGIQGSVSLEFTVKTDGTIAAIKIINSTNKGFNNEALRLIQLTSGMWIPAVVGGKQVSAKYYYLVKFKL